MCRAGCWTKFLVLMARCGSRCCRRGSPSVVLSHLGGWGCSGSTAERCRAGHLDPGEVAAGPVAGGDQDRLGRIRHVEHRPGDDEVKAVRADVERREHGLADVAGWVSYGASPRASLGIVAAARALGAAAGPAGIERDGDTLRIGAATTLARIGRDTISDRTGANSVYQVTTAWLILLTWPLYLLAIIFGPSVLAIFGHSYQAGSTVMVILGLAIGLVLTLAAGRLTAGPR